VFEKFEAKRGWLRTKRFRPEEEGIRGPHVIRLPMGMKPTYIQLTPYQEFAWHIMGGFVKRRENVSHELEDDLLKAHMKIRPEEYMAVVYMTTLLAFIGSVVAGLAVLGLLWGPLGPLTAGILAVIIIVLVPAITYGLTVSAPNSAKKKRQKLIDARITGSMSFISAMASADVPVDVIFKELSKQPVYGEVAEEAKWITRDTELLGVDILTAIRQAAGRSPSTKFQDFLQGVVTTSTSGGQLKPYFLMKAEQFEKEDRLEMRQKMETLGMLAESFVTVVVAFPLFLVVIIAIMALISKGSSDFVLNLLYVVVGLMIPMSQAGFIFAIWNMEQEA
jgi:flagellar protein FlaJ